MSLVNKYINSNDFLTATAVYDDVNLTTLSPDGFYQFGGNYRQQLLGVLGSSSVCDVCYEPCGTGLVIPGGDTGLYNLTFNAGGTLADVGAIVVYFNPAQVPDGIRVLYNGVYYNKTSNETTGVIQSTSGVNDAFTILGDPAATCVPAPGTYSYDYFDGYTGATWDAGDPTPQDVTITAGDDQRGAAGLWSTLVIPKPLALPNIVSVQVLGPCASTGWNLEVNCPADLESFNSSSNQGSSTACVTDDQRFYFARHRGFSNALPVVTNFVFSDSNGVFPLANGNYVMSDNNVITVVNGVVTAIVACTP